MKSRDTDEKQSSDSSSQSDLVLSANPDDSKWESHVFSVKEMWKQSLLLGACLTKQTTVSCLKAAAPNPSLFPLWRCPDDVSIVVNPLTTRTATQQCAGSQGVCACACVSRHSAQSSSGVSGERSVKIGWKHSVVLWFPWNNLTSGSLPCLFESVTSLTRTEKCDCDVITKIMEVRLEHNDSFIQTFHIWGFDDITMVTVIKTCPWS